MIGRWLKKIRKPNPSVGSPSTTLVVLPVPEHDIALFEKTLSVLEDEWGAFVPEVNDYGFYHTQKLIGYARLSETAESNPQHRHIVLDEVNLLPAYRGQKARWGTRCAHQLATALNTKFSLHRQCKRMTLDMEAASRRGITFCHQVAEYLERHTPGLIVITRIYHSPQSKPAGISV